MDKCDCVIFYNTNNREFVMWTHQLIVVTVISKKYASSMVVLTRAYLKASQGKCTPTLSCPLNG